MYNIHIYKQYIRIFPQEKKYICVSISLRKSFLNLIIPRMGLLQKIVLPFTSVRFLPPAKKKKKGSTKKRILFHQFVVDLKITPLS